MRLDNVPTPSYVIDESKLEENCKLLAGVMERTGCKILLAQKAFSAFAEYPMIGKYLAGTTASGLFEARLGKEEMGKENHIFCGATGMRIWMRLHLYATILCLIPWGS